MALPYQDVIREQRFIHAHPEWSIRRLGDRFSATRNQPNQMVTRQNLGELIDRLESIVTAETSQ